MAGNTNRHFGPFNYMSRAKNWVFTVNNYTDEEHQALQTIVETNDNVVYIIFGRETGEQGTPHLQGYLVLHNRMRLQQVKRLPGLSRAHLELRRGSHEQAREYCSKDGDVFEAGVAPSGQGVRNDLKVCLE